MRPFLTRLVLTGSFLALCTACSASSPPPSRADLPPQAQLVECLRERSYTMLAAHRAGPGPGFAENALSSIRRNGALGVLYAEVDVAESTDGALFLMHDWTFDRTTTGAGRIEEASWDYIRTLNLVDPDGQVLTETVPAFADAVLAAREAGVYLNLDLKNVSIERLVEAVHAAGADDEVIIIAYTVEDAARIHALNPNLVLSAPNEPAALAAAGVNLDNVYLWLGVGEADADLDAELADNGLETAIGLFPLETGDAALYQRSADAGIEILSIDDVITGSSALGGAAALTDRIEACRPRTG